MTALSKRIVRQITNDKRTVAMIIVAPIFILTMMYFLLGESTFDSLGYVFLGVISFFLIFIVSGMALVRERSGGTLERMLMAPVTRRGIVAGYTMGYSLFAAVQAIILVLFTIYVLGVPCGGSVALVVCIMLMLAISAVSFGELISIFTDTEFQVVQLIPVVIIPQVFFSGLIPLDTIPYHLGNLGYIMPVFYGCSAIEEVMREGNGMETIWPYLLALIGYITALNVLNTLALRRYRRI
jgi:ABC-2 type transport system permease protein